LESSVHAGDVDF